MLSTRVTEGTVPENVPATKDNVGVPEIEFASVNVAVTVTRSPDLYGPVRLEEPPSVYARATVGAVLSTTNAVAAVLGSVFPAVSEADTDAETVPFSPAWTEYVYV